MRLLLIEDDVFFVKFYAKKLLDNGYVIDTAVNGQEGLEKAVQNKPDLILLDLILPVKDGFEVLRSLARDPNLKQVPVVVFSTLGQEQDVKKAIILGAKGYVNKSFFDFDKLLKEISFVIQQSKTQTPTQDLPAQPATQVPTKTE